ncbi:MAG: hypothetical protein V4732_19415 [Pseudomonadota bacterium]
MNHSNQLKNVLAILQVWCEWLNKNSSSTAGQLEEHYGKRFDSGSVVAKAWVMLKC